MKILNQKKQFKESLDLFDKSIETNKQQQLSSLAITQALKACTAMGDFQRGSNIHNLVSSRIKTDSFILTSLIHFYMQCNNVKHAESLFDLSTNKTLFMYGAMMKGYIKNGMAEKAIELFYQIKNPDDVIFLLLFNAFAQLKTEESLNLIKNIWKQIPKKFYSNTYLLTSLIDALLKCEDIESAQLLFDRSKEKTVEMYGAMMKGYIKNQMIEKAIELFYQIKTPDEVIFVLLFNACAQLGTDEALDLIKKVWQQIPKQFHSNVYILTSLIDALMVCGNVKSAESLFNMSSKKVLPMYGAMMRGFNKNEMPYQTINLYNKIKSKKLNIINETKSDDIQSNIIIHLHAINALSQIGIYSLSQSIVEQMPKNLLSNHIIQNSLIDMWGKVGSIEKAKEIFQNITQLDHISYTTMVNSYGLNGMGLEALELFHQIPFELIEESTYVSILNACSHSGLIDQARSIFKNIQIKTEKIYGAMVDCLSRGSLFQEAQQIIDQYECDHSPSWPMYMSLLSGARNEKKNNLAENIYYRMKKIFPHLIDPLISATILLANVYASSGNIEKASNIRKQLIQSGVKKQIGLTWTMVNGELFQFQAHDQSHPQSNEIYNELEKISRELIEHGHEYDSSWVTRPLNEDETISSVLCGHSERIAIAFNFLRNPNVSRIQITKNLRICGDCHRATKLIANIRQCEIIVRDANRIHYFHTNGQCSCNDYF